MRQKLNENPVAQIALIGVLVLVAGYFVLTSMSGGESEEGEVAAPAETAEAAPEAGGLETASPASATSSVAAPAAGPLPPGVEAAYDRGETLVVLIYREGGIDDQRVAAAARAVTGMPEVALFEAPAKEVAEYAAITGPLGVNQAPALIVVRSRDLNGDAAAPATVAYGFQTPADIRQAVVDSGYRGPHLTYAPN